MSRSEKEVELVALARKIYMEAMLPDPAAAMLGRDSSAARAAYQKFVDDMGNGGSLDMKNAHIVAQLLERMLDVDMTLPANRKGAIPAALNLVSRIDPKTDALHRTIYLVMDHLLHQSDKHSRLPSGNRCASEVVKIFHEMGFKLDERQVLKIYDRWAAAGPGPHGPSPARERNAKAKPGK